MGTNKKNLTEQDLMELLRVKMKEPDLQLTDIYKGINSIHPPVTEKLVLSNIFPAVLGLVSLGVMIFNSNSNWTRTSLIGYILSSTWITYNFKRYVDNAWLPLLILCTLGYIASSTTLDIKEVFELIKSVIL